LEAQNQKTLKFLVFNKYKGVADLGYEGLNMQVRETSIHKTSGFSSYFFHTLIKQRPLGNTVADIQHIGSTSVPGLAAKPVIDILLGVEHIPPQTSQIADLETLGYLYCGELGIPGRHYFRLLNAPHPSNSLSEVDG